MGPADEAFIRALATTLALERLSRIELERSLRMASYAANWQRKWDASAWRGESKVHLFKSRSGTA